MDRQKPASIAVFAPNSWTGPWMNRQQFFSRIAKRGWEVCYSTGRVNLWHGLAAAWKEASLLPAYQVIDSVKVDQPSLLHLESERFSFLNQFTLRGHAKTIRKRLPRPIISYLFHPLFEPYIDALKSDYVVLHLYDALHAMPDWTQKKQLQLERCARQAHLIITSSEQMQDGLPDDVLAKTLTIENGADWQAFNRGAQGERPNELRTIDGVMIGCCGVMSQKTDIELLQTIAQAKPEWTLILIGPYFFGRDVMQDHRWNALTARQNVKWLGLKQPSELPRYVGHMNANLIPYRIDDPNAGWAPYCFPLKLHEYLATGKPVISSPLPAILKFGHVLSFAKTPEEWIAAIQTALISDSAEFASERIQVARANSWDRKVDALSEALEQLTRHPTMR